MQSACDDESRDEGRESRIGTSGAVAKNGWLVAGEEAGASAQRMSDVFSESRASSLGKGFENAAPAWPAKRSPASSLSCVFVCFVVNPEK